MSFSGPFPFWWSAVMATAVFLPVVVLAFFLPRLQRTPQNRVFYWVGSASAAFLPITLGVQAMFFTDVSGLRTERNPAPESLAENIGSFIPWFGIVGDLVFCAVFAAMMFHALAMLPPGRPRRRRYALAWALVAGLVLWQVVQVFLA